MWHTIDSSQGAVFTLGHNKKLDVRVNATTSLSYFHDFNNGDVWLEAKQQIRWVFLVFRIHEVKVYFIFLSRQHCVLDYF